MRILTAGLYLSLAALLGSCDQQPAPTESELRAGLECFEGHRASLPPGAQYEGIERGDDDRLMIKVMNGVEVVTLECEQSDLP